MTQPTQECVLELLKLSSNVGECKPLAAGTDHHPHARAGHPGVRDAQGRGLHSSTFPNQCKHISWDTLGA